MHTAGSASADQTETTASSAAQLAPAAPASHVLLRRNSNSTNNAAKIGPPSATGTVEIQFGNFTTQVPVSKAGTTLNCGTNSFHVQTGTNSGTCTTNYAEGTVSCADGANKATAKCVSGCGNTSGAGDCTQS